MDEVNGGSGLEGVDRGVDSASVHLSGVDIGSDKGLKLRLAGRGGRADTASMHAYDRRASCPPPWWTSGT